AYPSSMADQVYVGFVVAVIRNHQLHQTMSFVVRALLRNQVESPRYSKDMNIDRKHGTIAGEQQGASYGLGSYALKTREKLFGFVEGRLGKEREVEGPSALVDLVE